MVILYVVLGMLVLLAAVLLINAALVTSRARKLGGEHPTFTEEALKVYGETFSRMLRCATVSHKEGHDDTLDMLGMAKYTASVQENNALQTISWNIDTHDRTLGQPLVVFNPHSFPVTDTVQVNAAFDSVVDAQGAEIPCPSTRLIT